MSRRNLVVLQRHGEDGRGDLANLNYGPWSIVDRSGEPGAVGHGVVAPLVEEIVDGHVRGVIDRGARHDHELRRGGYTNVNRDAPGDGRCINACAPFRRQLAVSGALASVGPGMA